MNDDDWPDFPVILGQGTVHDLRDAEGLTPRLYGMRSVSKAACWALHSEPKVKRRRAGFIVPNRQS
jgi:hypothetical protein